MKSFPRKGPTASPFEPSIPECSENATNHRPSFAVVRFFAGGELKLDIASGRSYCFLFRRARIAPASIISHTVAGSGMAAIASGGSEGSGGIPLPQWLSTSV